MNGDGKSGPKWTFFKEYVFRFAVILNTTEKVWFIQKKPENSFVQNFGVFFSKRLFNISFHRTWMIKYYDFSSDNGIKYITIGPIKLLKYIFSY